MKMTPSSPVSVKIIISSPMSVQNDLLRSSEGKKNISFCSVSAKMTSSCLIKTNSYHVH